MNVLGCFAGQHDLMLVGLAAAICASATFGALMLAGHARLTDGRMRILWLSIAAVVAGVGIWATHFVAMLAFDPGLPTGYALLPTAGSLAVAVGFTAAGFLLGLRTGERRDALLGGAVLGLGIGAMHYTGMTGYLVAGRIVWTYALVALSLALGVALAAASLATLVSGRRGARALAAVLFVLGICALHFTGMAAVGIVPDPRLTVPPRAIDGHSLALAVSLAEGLIVLFSLLGLAAEMRGRARSLAENNRMRSLADAAVEGLLICEDDRIVTANASFVALSGHTPTAMAALRLGTVFPDGAIMQTLMTQPDAAQELELATADGRRIPVEVISHPIVFAGRPHLALAVRDLRARRQAEARIRYLAHHDVLTGLPNRAWFDATLDSAIATAAERGETLAVLCLDLDRFKEVNDLFGHPAGDEALKTLARLLSSALGLPRLVARLGGDEFAALLVGADLYAAQRAADAVLAAVARQAAEVAAGPKLGVSIGIALFPADGTDRTGLLSAADTALYRAKAEGRGIFRFYEARMGHAVRERRRLEHDLRSAIDRKELELVYQPQIETGSGTIKGFEALLRWRHPERGYVSPSLFVPIAEESGAILSIGEWVLRRACEEAATWGAPLRVAVNVSPVQLHAPSFADFVERTLKATGIDPCRLELEITETALIRDIGRALAALRRLKDLGVKIAMDDFGTGYSSLSNLRAFPFDRIKIDGSFVRAVDENPQGAAIVRAILELGRGLDLPILAEGVETLAELGFLNAESCHEVQGYLLGRPAPIATFAAATQGADPALPAPERPVASRPVEVANRAAA